MYFTSHAQKRLFVGESAITNWEYIQFFLFVVIVEHLLLFLKLVVENLIEDVPPEVQRGERERSSLIRQYKHAKEASEVTCKIKAAFASVKAARRNLGAWAGRAAPPAEEAPTPAAQASAAVPTSRADIAAPKARPVSDKLAAIKEKARVAKAKRRAIQGAEPHPSEALPPIHRKANAEMRFQGEVLR